MSEAAITRRSPCGGPCGRRSLLVAAIGATALAQWPVSSGGATRILVVAAASLKDVLEALGREFARTHGSTIRYAFAATSSLVRQLEQGLQADLFISADQEWMDHAVRRGLVERDSVVDLCGNQLVLVAPRGVGEAFALHRGGDLGQRLGKGRLAVADVNAVPAGRYAKEALVSLAMWEQVSGRLALTENVRAALLLAARGEVPLAIVYETDARSDARVQVIARFPPQAHRPISYPAALVRGHAGSDAVALHRFLRSPAAAGVFRDYGFAVPG